MAALGVVDAHVHVWDPSALSYPWLAAHPAIDVPRLPAHLDDAGGAIDAWVFVEADAAPADTTRELDWVESLAWDGLAGVVAGIDLTRADIGDEVARLRARGVAGVRHGLQGVPVGSPWPDGLSRGLDAVASAGLVFDACVGWEQLPALAELLRERPQTRVVLDHVGKPPVAAGMASEEGRAWLSGVTAVAQHPGIAVKLSGLPAEAGDADALRRHGPDFLRAALDLFGADACMFATDWPVSVGAEVSAGEWLDLVADAAGGSDASAIFAGTARRVYGLAQPRT
jgi:L-fuconolactonase